MNDPISYTTKEAAQVTGISFGTLVRWRGAGVGPAYVQRGRVVLYARRSLEKWLQANTVRTYDQRAA